MNKEYFIARKIHQGNSEDKKVSRPIIRISKLSITLAMIVNIITLAVVTGFQNQVKDKVTGFGAHANIMRAGDLSVFESSPFVFDSVLYHTIDTLKEVHSISPFAYKPALLQSSPDTVWYTVKQVDTFQVQQQIYGLVMKGVSNSFDWSFFEKHMVAGRLPRFHDSIKVPEILISSQVAKDLQVELNDHIRTFFIKKQPVKIPQKVVGIFETGLEEFDKQVIFGDLKQVQKMNDWGIQTAIRIADTITKNGQLVIYGEVRGGNGNYKYDWGEGFETAKGFTFCAAKDTTIRLIAGDYWSSISKKEDDTMIPDTAYIEIKVVGNKTLPCYLENLETNKIEKTYLDELGLHFRIDFYGGKSYEIKYIDGNGTSDHYIGGFEVVFNDFNTLTSSTNKIKKLITFNPLMNLQHEYRIRNIEEEQEDVFVWLSFLDLNVLIILVLMILVSTINMGSGLLVLILTKTQLIGLLKAIGASNWSIRKIFLHQAVFILLKSMIYGNIIGLSLCFIQMQFNLIPLNPEVYYLNTVPIELPVFPIVLLNIGTLILCTAALLIPSYVITKISPQKAIRFQ